MIVQIVTFRAGLPEKNVLQTYEARCRGPSRADDPYAFFDAATLLTEATLMAGIGTEMSITLPSATSH